jgi:AhpD family alkylhydroperoxidase
MPTTDASARRHAKISRLPPLPEPLDPETRAWFERVEARGGSVLNLHLATAHAPKIATAKNPLAMVLRSECDSPRIYRELAIVRVGQLMECAYELDHHAPVLRACGMSDAQMAALTDWRLHLDLFDEASRAVLAFVDAMAANKGDVDDATYAALARCFPPKQIVEITYNAIIYFANALLLKALRIELDEPHVRTTPGKF